MKISAYLCVVALLTACGPRPDDTTDTQTTTTKTITTVTTSSSVATTPTDTPPVAVPPTTLTQANLDRVHTDMSPAEVQAIFGPPTSSDSKPIPIVGGTATTYSYSNGSSAVTIIFKNNLVKEKSGTFGP